MTNAGLINIGSVTLTRVLTVTIATESYGYTYDPTTENENGRTIQGFSTSAEKKWASVLTALTMNMTNILKLPFFQNGLTSIQPPHGMHKRGFPFFQNSLSSMQPPYVMHRRAFPLFQYSLALMQPPHAIHRRDFSFFKSTSH